MISATGRGGRRSPPAGAPAGTGRRYLRHALTFILFLALAFVAARIDRMAAVRPTGAAVVNDGDTVTLAGQRIRLRGIDAPEYGQTCSRGGSSYACGRQARRELEALIGGRVLSCEGWEKDRYGRLLAVCRAGEVDLNRRMVEAGWAVSFGDYADAEGAARRAGRGLWEGEFTRPREWRDRHGGIMEGEHDVLGTLLSALRRVLGL
jgi:endonuclease YncB( thermonuclease family)